METNTQITILNAFREGDALITQVRYDYTGELEASITVDIYHFQPSDQEEVDRGIQNRGESEKKKLMSIKKIDQIIDNLNGTN